MAKQRPMKLEDLFRLKALGRVAISPDAAQVAFELKRFDYEKNKNFVNLMSVDAGGGKMRELTRGDHVDQMPRWSPDGSRLAFTSDRDKGRTLWVMDMAGGEPRRITETDGWVSDFAWSPDGRRIAYAYHPMNEREKLERDEKSDELKKRPAFKHITRLFHKLDGAGYWNGEYTHIWIINADGGKPKQLTRGDYDDAEPRFSPDGRLVSFVSNRVDNPDLDKHNNDIYTVRASGGAIRRITQMEGGAAGHSWSPDGKTIAYIGNPSRRGNSYKYLDRVWLVPASGGKPRELTTDIDNECFNVTLGDVAAGLFDALPPIWTPDSKRVYFPVSEQGATRLYSRSVDRRDTRCEVDGHLNIYAAQRTGRDGPIALSIGTPTNPGDVYLYDPAGGGRATGVSDDRLQRLTQVNDAVLSKLYVAEPEHFTVKSDKLDIDAWVLKPPGFDAKKKYPAILEIHGGPAGQYGAAFFHEMQWMASKGYVVVFGNPRGSAGYGVKFRNAIQFDWGNLDYKDVSRIADWLFKQRYVDGRRVGVTGGSYGGYMTNWLVAHTRRFRAAVTQRSVVSFESFYGVSDVGYLPGWMGPKPPWDDPKPYRKQSPLTHVKKVRTPLLIIHSEEDWRCPVSQADELFIALKMLEVETELVRFEGESHGLSRGGRPQNRAERLRQIMRWMDKHLAKA